MTLTLELHRDSAKWNQVSRLKVTQFKRYRLHTNRTDSSLPGPSKWSVKKLCTVRIRFWFRVIRFFRKTNSRCSAGTENAGQNWTLQDKTVTNGQRRTGQWRTRQWRTDNDGRILPATSWATVSNKNRLVFNT